MSIGRRLEERFKRVVNGAEVTIYEQGYKYKDGNGNEHQSDDICPWVLR